jgi:murein DD-endopeptidase MepM/ murein hydrolase activator NlpD
MKRILNLLLLMFLISCVNAPVTGTLAAATNTNVDFTATSPSLTVAPFATSPAPPPTTVPSITPTINPTPEPPCDAFTADFCITDGHFILQRPIQPPGNDLIDPVYGYGSTVNGTREPHHGVEFSDASGTPVHAAAEGTVIFAGPDQQAIYAPWWNFYGNLVVIEHSGDVFTLYAHLSKIDVALNQQVLAGDKIGEVGRTGGAVGSHLHFEVRRGDVKDYFATQNPELWLVPAKDRNGNPFGTLSISLVDGEGKLIEKANFTIGYYSDPSQPPVKVYYAIPYAHDLLTGEEVATLGALDAGQYRIVVEMNGQLLERWVEVQSGRLTQVVFVIK